MEKDARIASSQFAGIAYVPVRCRIVAVRCVSERGGDQETRSQSSKLQMSQFFVTPAWSDSLWHGMPTALPKNKPSLNCFVTVNLFRWKQCRASAGNQVFLYPASDLAVIVSEHSPEDNLNDQAAVEHARVIADCFKSSTVLPFRFGTVFSDDDALRRSIRSNQRQFLTNIDRLRGKAEMHLKVTARRLLPGTAARLWSPPPWKHWVGQGVPDAASAKVPPGSASARPRRGPSPFRCTGCSRRWPRRSAAVARIPGKCCSTSRI